MLKRNFCDPRSSFPPWLLSVHLLTLCAKRNGSYVLKC
ncbi:hypothetical protein NFI96_017644 [Prochilodus magdalenae]|nr:hypothetical protein NFI96_017644 [Prochilodus magdalenae]